MFVVGDNLRALIEQHGIVDSPQAFDHSSLTLRLASTVMEVGSAGQIVVYGEDIKKGTFVESTIPTQGYVLEPRACILACSKEKIKIPLGYLGFVQTKGSLARLFVTVHCCDAQIDPGFNGNVTFEMVNLGPLRVKLRTDQEVARLFIAKTTTKEVVPYQGRYQDADGPTPFKKKQ